MKTRLATGLLGAALLAATPTLAADPALNDTIPKLTRATQWQQKAAVTLQFPTFHPQGMVKIGDAFFVSSVDIRKPTNRFPTPQGGYDRDTGEGVGHLFKFDAEGRLLADLTLGEGSIYHPGGIDFDGQHIWVPVAEYRPNSQSIIYKVDPATMKATEVFRFKDHIGGIVHNRRRQRRQVAARRQLGRSRRILQMAARRRGQDHQRERRSPNQLRVANRRALYRLSGLADFIGRSRMLCSGLNNYRVSPDAPVFRLGLRGSWLSDRQRRAAPRGHGHSHLRQTGPNRGASSDARRPCPPPSGPAGENWNDTRSIDRLRSICQPH
ncbi:hypothetical protein BTHI11S_04347 [Bosea thiooxidans]